MNENKCSSCGDTKKECPCKNKDFTKAVIEIDNPEQITLMRKVVIPASMGDDITVPPVVGKYHNVLLYYEANQKSYLYSSDGIPTQLVNGVTDYEAAVNLPQINGVTLLGNKSAADLELADAPMVITVAAGNTSWSGADTAEDVYDFFLNKGKVNIVFEGGENYTYELSSAGYIENEGKLLCVVVAASTQDTGGVTDSEGNALFGTMTLYTAGKAVDVSQIELQPKLFVADFTGLDLNYNELSGVPATTYSIGMVKPGDGLEVASDGTLSISDIEQYAHLFDTVADMKAATNLVDGDYARTAGYWGIGDNGGSLYKIIDDDSLADDGGSIIDISNNLKAVLIYGNTLNVAQFGITSTHTDNQASMVAFVNANNISDLEFNPIEYSYDTGFTITSDELTIHGNGCTIVPTDTVGDFYIFRITGNNIKLEDVNIDGRNIPQDQWTITSHTELTLRRCFYINSKIVNINNVNIQNIWGEGIQILNFNTVKITNCIMDKIGGGFYRTDSQGYNDYFGDAFYFGGHNGDAEIVIENCLATGYQETGERSRGSRIGVVLENLGDYTPAATTLSINNSELTRFNRALHVEAYTGDINMTVDNCRILQDCSICMYANRPKLLLKNTNFTQTAENYNGSRGLRNFDFVYEDSIINIEDGGTFGIAMETSKGRIIRTTINGIKDTQISNVQRLDIEDSILNFNNDTGYTIYSSGVYCYRCVFNNSANTFKYSTAGSPYRCQDCIFNDIVPNAKPMIIAGRLYATSNVVYSTTDTPTTSQLLNPNDLGMFTVYVNNVLVSKPSICKVLDADEDTNLFNNVTQAIFSDTATEFPIVPDNMPSTFLPNRNSRYILIIRGSENATNRYNSDFTQCYYTTLVYDKNGSPTIDSITTVGNPASGGFALSFDTVNGTVTKATSYSQYVNRVIYWILPYDYKDRIASFNP